MSEVMRNGTNEEVVVNPDVETDEEKLTPEEKLVKQLYEEVVKKKLKVAPLEIELGQLERKKRQLTKGKTKEEIEQMDDIDKLISQIDTAKKNLDNENKKVGLKDALERAAEQLGLKIQEFMDMAGTESSRIKSEIEALKIDLDKAKQNLTDLESSSDSSAEEKSQARKTISEIEGKIKDLMLRKHALDEIYKWAEKKYQRLLNGKKSTEKTAEGTPGKKDNKEKKKAEEKSGKEEKQQPQTIPGGGGTVVAPQSDNKKDGKENKEDKKDPKKERFKKLKDICDRNAMSEDDLKKFKKEKVTEEEIKELDAEFEKIYKAMLEDPEKVDKWDKRILLSMLNQERYYEKTKKEQRAEFYIKTSIEGYRIGDKKKFEKFPEYITNHMKILENLKSFAISDTEIYKDLPKNLADKVRKKVNSNIGKWNWNMGRFDKAKVEKVKESDLEYSELDSLGGSVEDGIRETHEGTSGPKKEEPEEPAV